MNYKGQKLMESCVSRSGYNRPINSPYELAQVAYNRTDFPRVLQLIGQDAFEAGMLQMNLDAYRKCKEAISKTTGRSVLEAMSPSDFKFLMSDVSQKIELPGYKYVEPQYPKIVTTRGVDDFKKVNPYRFSDIGDLERFDRVLADVALQNVPPSGEGIPYTSLSMENMSYGLYLYGLRVRNMWSLLVSADIDLIEKETVALGRSAIRTKEKAIWNMFNTNPNYLIDANPIFTIGAPHFNSHANALTIANLETAILAMTAQKDVAGNPILISGAYLIVPQGLTITARNIMKELGVITNPNQQNIIVSTQAGTYQPSSAGDFIKGLITTPYLTTAATPATCHWYLATEPNELPCFETLYLNGLATPQFLTSRGDFDQNVMGYAISNNFTVDIGVIDAFGYECTDYRGVYAGTP